MTYESQDVVFPPGVLLSFLWRALNLNSRTLHTAPRAANTERVQATDPRNYKGASHGSEACRLSVGKLAVCPLVGGGGDQGTPRSGVTGSCELPQMSVGD